MSRIDRSTDVRAALKSRQRGFLINPFRFGGGGGDGPPAIESSAIYQNGGNITSHSVTMPSGIVAGNLLVCIFSSDADASTTHAATGWTKLGSSTKNANSTMFSVFYKTAAGGDTLTVETSTAEQSAAIAYRLSAANSIEHAYNAFEANTTTYTPPPITPTAGSKNYLFIVFVVANAYGGLLFSSVPSGYTEKLDAQSVTTTTGNGVEMSSASKIATASSETPGSFTLIASSFRCGGTLAIWN